MIAAETLIRALYEALGVIIEEMDQDEDQRPGEDPGRLPGAA